MRENWVILHVSKRLEEEVFCWNLHTVKAQRPYFNSASLSLLLITAFELLSPNPSGFGGWDLSVVDSRNVAQVRHSHASVRALWFPFTACCAALGQVCIPISQPLNPGMIHGSQSKCYQPNLCCVWFFMKCIEITGMITENFEVQRASPSFLPMLISGRAVGSVLYVLPPFTF